MSSDPSLLRVAVVIASTRKGRRGEGYARWIESHLAARPGVELSVLDLRDHTLPPYDHEKMPTAIERQYEEPALRRWSEIVHALDGYVFVTPEYNHGYPGQLKNAIDHVQQGWWYKPVGFVSYGGNAGGSRAVEQLRTVAIEVRMVPVRSEVNLRLMGLQTDEAGRPTEAVYAKHAGMMIDELLWWARVAKDGRARVTPPGL